MENEEDQNGEAKMLAVDVDGEEEEEGGE
ncbi:hypothetical protein A2U01_0112920, partial [Trifolium medium]|nr:hypothetical protein [Trifolium medium]